MQIKTGQLQLHKGDLTKKLTFISCIVMLLIMVKYMEELNKGCTHKHTHICSCFDRLCSDIKHHQFLEFYQVLYISICFLWVDSTSLSDKAYNILFHKVVNYAEVLQQNIYIYTCTHYNNCIRMTLHLLAKQKSIKTVPIKWNVMKLRSTNLYHHDTCNARKWGVKAEVMRVKYQVQSVVL